MTPEQFTYWLQGFAELQGGINGLNDTQWQIIKDHLNTVFHKVTPHNKPIYQPNNPFIPNVNPFPHDVYPMTKC